MNRKYLENLLKLCTPRQLELYSRMYPQGPTDKQVPTAIKQVESTLSHADKNAEELKQSNIAYKEEIDNLTRTVSTLNEKVIELTEKLQDRPKVDFTDSEYKLAKLWALECAGVDNWDGYDFAMQSMVKFEDDEDE